MGADVDNNEEEVGEPDDLDEELVDDGEKLGEDVLAEDPDEDESACASAVTAGRSLIIFPALES